MNAHYVYRCFGNEGRLLYVGCTRDLGTRLDNHAARSFWAPQVRRIVARVYPDKEAARDAERAAIRSERPRFNIQGRPAPDAASSLEEFDDYIAAREQIIATTGPTEWLTRHLGRVKRMRAHVAARVSA